jgi:diguanylate cyclase (GGDEF)-like protein
LGHVFLGESHWIDQVPSQGDRGDERDAGGGIRSRFRSLWGLRRWIRRSVARRVAVATTLVATVAATAIGLTIVHVVLADEAARSRMALVAFAGGAGTVLSVALATAVIVNRVLHSSLHDLRNALGAAEKGRWLRSVASDRPDEIGDVARAFDRLAATVTDLSVSVIDADRELAWTRRELQLKDALSLLFELTQTINAESDLPSILAAVPERVCSALGFEQMAVLLFDEGADEFVVRATHGIAAGAVGVAFPRSDGISGRVADTGEPLVIPDTAKDARYSHFRGTHPVDGAFACVPMRVQGRLVGLFNVLRPGAASISDGDLRLLSSLASYAGLAIDHAEMNLRLRDLAVTDELTGVANRRLLLDRLGRELERARRSGKPLAFLMLDLDHFKSWNDELGHQKGDEVLRAVAGALSGVVRRVDTVGRYGGEEFSLLLPDTTRAQALVVAEKLRLAVAALDLGRPLTVSIGVAVHPDDAGDDASLVGAADEALLAAKRAGRDRVIAAASGRPATSAV